MSILSFILLQVDTATQVIAGMENTGAEELSLIYLLREGGVLMIPLLLCSVLMLYVFIERLRVIRKAGNIHPTFMARIKEHVTDGNLVAAKNLAKTTQGPMARIIDKGLSRIGKPVDHIEKSMENTGKLQVYNLEKNLSMLSTIAGIAPMFGFLGTIAGMIILFFNIQHNGFSIEHIAGGIYTKMVTSAVGLIIGLLSYVAYNYLNAQINKTVNKMEAAAVEFLDILHEPTR
ncbi:MAG: MotA/TolQ/ExbB proton channel family protein [Chitinophagaceae bacterium]|nr:MotA/TolQ/ExbB proton channel family protein [Chitinophagaceae bacterium]